MIIENIQEARKILQHALEEGAPSCFFTGAGISTASGIPDFRSPGGIWSRYRIVEFDEFLVSEEARREDWDRRFHMMEVFKKATPNIAHKKIANLIQQGKATGVITQNIDGLHTIAGVPRDHLIEFHGMGTHAHCLSCGGIHQIADVEIAIEKEGRTPQCHCGGIIKAAVVSFGESVPRQWIEQAILMVDSAHLMVAVGSSCQVWPAAGLLQRALEREIPVIIVNRDPTPFDNEVDFCLRLDICQVFDF